MASRFFSYPTPPMRIGREPSTPGRYGYYGGPEPEASFQDLTFGPWRSGAIPYRNWIPAPFPMATRIFDQQFDRRPSPESRQAWCEPKMPFGQAMKKLHKQLSKAEVFYREFLSSFDRDVENIKKYAAPQILKELWLLKVMGGDRNKISPPEKQGIQSDSDNDTSPVLKAHQFEVMQAKIIQALEIATTSTVDSKSGSHKATSRLDSAQRLREKISVASEQIQDLLQRASKGRKSCDELCYELELLKALVDPWKNMTLNGISAGREDLSNYSRDRHQKDDDIIQSGVVWN